MRAGASSATKRGDVCIDDAGAGGNRVGRMQGGAVVVTDRGRDAGLRPDG